MFNTPQRIELKYDGRPIVVEVWRYTTPTELHAALTNAGIKDFDTKTVVYTQVLESGPKHGVMYMLDSSVETMAAQAAKMAFGIGHREHVIDFVPEWEDVISHLIGTITSALYSNSKHF